MEKFTLKLTSAVALDGVIQRAGALVEVTERVARDLLQRGKAVPEGAEPAAEPEAPAEEAAQEPEAPAGKKAKAK